MDTEEFRNQGYLKNPKKGEEKPLLVEMANASIELGIEKPALVEKAKKNASIEAAKEGEEIPHLVEMANRSIKAALDLAHKGKGFKPEDVKKGIGRHPLYFYNNIENIEKN